ncbi:MAG: type II toxin-antitoxin system VapC family toxin [Pyrinomonadaceae bacterium]
MDSGFWYASIDESDVPHNNVYPIVSANREQVVIPIPVITETAYLINKNRGVEPLAIFVKNLAKSKFVLSAPTSENYLRTAEILQKYNDSNVDFIDALIFAMAEAANITKILTVDRRHFSMFRPAHCDSFEILP